MGNPDHCGSYPEASFCLTTRHDFLGVYLHYVTWACPFSGHIREDGDNLFQCTGLDEYPTDDVVSRTGRLGVICGSTARGRPWPSQEAFSRPAIASVLLFLVLKTRRSFSGPPTNLRFDLPFLRMPIVSH
ncbi:hypothetical protein TNCV_4434211 [Trichonephila clavipes]|nr:hypothetical protein TNCV_4434211 [Trichonephila clavipes]